MEKFAKRVDAREAAFRCKKLSILLYSEELNICEYFVMDINEFDIFVKEHKTEHIEVDADETIEGYEKNFLSPRM